MLTRDAADLLLVEFDPYVRGNGKPPQQQPASAVEGDGGGQVDAGGQPLPNSEGFISAEDVPEDPEEAKDMILAEVRDQLDWDGKSGDPNDSVAALEDALADMFDADVEIVWDGESALTLRVEGEEPVPLTIDYLGQLLEELAKSGSASGVEDDAGPPDQADGGEDMADSVGGQRSVVGKFTEDLHPRVLGGVGGGRFTKKSGGAVSNAAKNAVKPDGKPGGGKPGGGGGGKPGGPKPSKLASRAHGRAGPRATSKAVGGALSAGTGQRVKVSGNKDGSFNVGSKKKKMSGKKVAAILIASWLAFGVAAGLMAAATGLPLGITGAAATVATLVVWKAIRS